MSREDLPVLSWASKRLDFRVRDCSDGWMGGAWELRILLWFLEALYWSTESLWLDWMLDFIVISSRLVMLWSNGRR